MPKDTGYDVGYGKPPASSRFRKGVSGNPKGRPRKSPEFTIEKGVPIPRKHSAVYDAITALSRADVGDSMLFPSDVSRGAINAAMRQVGRGWATSRTDGTGVRVWKVREP